MIAPGCTCTCRQVPNVTWVVKRRITDGHWQLIARDGPNYIGRVAGEGDIVVIADAATYQPAAALKRNRVTYYVVEDLGDAVDLISAQYSTPTKGGEPVTVSAGYVMRCPKADLAMEDM